MDGTVGGRNRHVWRVVILLGTGRQVKLLSAGEMIKKQHHHRSRFDKVITAFAVAANAETSLLWLISAVNFTDMKGDYATPFCAASSCADITSAKIMTTVLLLFKLFICIISELAYHMQVVSSGYKSTFSDTKLI